MDLTFPTILKRKLNNFSQEAKTQYTVINHQGHGNYPQNEYVKAQSELYKVIVHSFFSLLSMPIV